MADHAPGAHNGRGFDPRPPAFENSFVRFLKVRHDMEVFMGLYDHFEDIVESTKHLSKATSYADALTAAIRQHDFRLGNPQPMRFRWREDLGEDVDCVSSGRHTLIYELEGTGKLYRVMIEPVQETHK